MIDTTRAQVELLNERQNLTDAETLTRTTSYILAELLDLPRDQEPVLADKTAVLRFTRISKSRSYRWAR
jgi:hypothetical protein